MSYINISKAAKLLGVSTRTLMRWDNSGKYKAHKEPLSNMRFYDEEDIRLHSIWFAINREEKEHLKKLSEVIHEKLRHINTRPLDLRGTIQATNKDEMVKSFAAVDQWKATRLRIHKKYAALPVDFKPKVTPDV